MAAVMQWQGLVERLRGREYRFGVVTQESPVHRVAFEVGLSDDEIVAVESRHDFKFPPDLRAFLQTALPKGANFPDWRSDNLAEIRNWLDMPRRGVLFDIHKNDFWIDAWGPRPSSVSAALQRGEELLAQAPALVPIFGHRMIPSAPHLPGNPVLSVVQTDIIYYGFNLADYLHAEFGLLDREPWPDETRPIRFWDDIIKFDD